MIGQRLKLARSASGLSLRDLESAIGNLVTAQAIGKYERNEDMPSSGVLSALARALNVSEDYLIATDDMVLDGVEFRKKGIASKLPTRLKTWPMRRVRLALSVCIGILASIQFKIFRNCWKSAASKSCPSIFRTLTG